MDSSGTGKSPNTSLSFRYNANNEELEELFDACEDDPLPPQLEATSSIPSEGASPKKGDKAPSILDKYFKSIRAADKLIAEKDKDEKELKVGDENQTPPKEISSSPIKEYLNRLGKKSVSEVSDVKELGGAHETWKIFQDFKFKIAQAVEDMKSRSLEEPKEKSVLRDSSISDSEENSAIRDIDLSVGDTDNQVSSLESSMQNLSELSQPVTAKASEQKSSLPCEKNESECSDDTQRNLGQSEIDAIKKEIFDDAQMDVESGVEALEDGIDGFSDISPSDNIRPTLGEFLPSKPPSENSNMQHSKSEAKPPPAVTFFTFGLYFLTFLVFMNYYMFPDSSLWNGFLLGIWVYYTAGKIKEYFMDTIFGDYEPVKQIQMRRNSAIPIYTIPSVKEHTSVKKYEGWVNHYISPEYDPCTYALNRTQTALMKLEGCDLRISYTKAKIAKRALWDEKIEKVEFYKHSLYNLTGARVILLPKGLVRRRLWSKKYPICIVLSQNEQIHVLEKENIPGEVKKATEQEKKKEPHDMETETSTSPEKKKKFMWRRRDKSPSLDVEPGKEGLRHRFVSKKKHKDKKPDAAPSGSETPEALTVAEKESANLKTDEPMYDAEQDVTKSAYPYSKEKEDTEEDIDEPELFRLKEFLEEAELEAGVEGASEGEWSVHIKQTKEPKYSRLYIFTRTGRDKHEWYRRISQAISGANSTASAETSTSEDKSASDPAQNKEEVKEGIETAVYKVSEKETVAFAKQATTNQGKTESLQPEGPALAQSRPAPAPPGPPAPPLADYEASEKNFWPFLLKIIETHEVSKRKKSEVGVMCELEPSPRKHSKSKKKPKGAKSSTDSRCECRILPAEVTWLNTVIARSIYDIARNAKVIARLQTRIQNKLATVKLPSFMSPLVVTELSLQGSCPLVERVCAPAWDERGLWLDADLRYDGGAYISILTQINLMKLKERHVTLEEQLLAASFEETKEHDFLEGHSLADQFPAPKKHNKPAVYDSDLEDSAESSDEEEFSPPKPSESAVQLSQVPEPTTGEPSQSSSSKKKFMRMVNKIATNKYFQQVTDYKYVKRAMEGLSNTDIKLHLEVQGLEGRVALNLPPPPHDRIWIGFRTNPQLVLKARPAVGQRTLRFAHITNWIEQKLSKEFEKVLVLPNMEDIMIDVLTPTPAQFE